MGAAGGAGSGRARLACRAVLWAAALCLGAEGALARTLCPARCSCDDIAAAASCADAGLEVVPIQLNPENTLINLTHNTITNVHFAFGFYTKLAVLDLSFNKIESLGRKNFESNSDMTHLNISSNNIETLDKGTFVGLGKLIELDLTANKIVKIDPQAFEDLERLERLLLSENKIIEFEIDAFKPLINLKVIMLNDNEILDIPYAELRHTERLEYLSLSKNLLVSIQAEEVPILKKIRRLDLNKNIISHIDNSAFDGLSMLRHLDLSENNLTTIPTVALSKLSNLTHLYLSGNFFEAVPAVSFQSLFNLKHLHLSKLENLSKLDARAFVDNINLEKIWMNDNLQMSSMPPRIFYGNPRLVHISIRNNALVTIEASHFPIDQLQVLQIAGNPLKCNCSLLWLWQLCQEYKANIKVSTNSTSTSTLSMDYNEIKCNTPEHLQNQLLLEISQSDIQCSMGWVLLATIILTICILCGITAVVFYYLNPLKKCKGDKSKQVMTSVMLNGEIPKLGSSLVYGGRPRHQEGKNDVDRYLMIGPSIPNNFSQASAPWPIVDKQLYHEENEDNIYQQFGYETIPHRHTSHEKPHIVYV